METQGPIYAWKSRQSVAEQLCGGYAGWPHIAPCYKREPLRRAPQQRRHVNGFNSASRHGHTCEQVVPESLRSLV